MTVTEIKSAIESNASDAAGDYFANSTEQNDYIVIAQRDGVGAAVAALEEMVVDDE